MGRGGNAVRVSIDAIPKPEPGDLGGAGGFTTL
jgi:hypothetical protein